MALIELNQSNFHEQVSNGIILVDFWAPWCGQCKIQLPILEELDEEIKDDISIGKVNIDLENELASDLGIMSIPTLLLFKNGEIIDKMVGVQNKQILLSKLMG